MLLMCCAAGTHAQPTLRLRTRNWWSYDCYVLRVRFAIHAACLTCSCLLSYGRRCDLVNDPATTSADDGQHLKDGWEGVVSSGWYCQPVNGTSFYSDHTWHHSLGDFQLRLFWRMRTLTCFVTATCPNDCQRKGRCHYGSCICDYLYHGLDCSNYTCPDCTSMADDRPKQCPAENPDCEQAMACEVRLICSKMMNANSWLLRYMYQIYDAYDVPVTLASVDAVDQRLADVNHLAAGTNLTIHPPPFVKYELSEFTKFDNCHYDFSIQQKVCRSCSEESHGICDYTTGHCVCDAQFSNFDCSYEACPHPTCNGDSPLRSV